MMGKKKKQIISRDDFSIYESICNPALCYAIYPDQINLLNEIRLKHFNEPIPDQETIKVFKFGKIKDKDSETEIWDIIDHKPIECRVNDLTSDSTGYKFCF